MCRNGEFEDKIERLKYLSITTLNVVDISQSGIISQTGTGVNILKNINQSGTNVIYQNGTGYNELKQTFFNGVISQSSNYYIDQYGPGTNSMKSTIFNGDVIQAASDTINQTGTGTNSLKATHVNGNISQSGGNVISQTGTGTNALKACSITGALGVSADITCPGAVNCGSVNSINGSGYFSVLGCANFRPNYFSFSNVSSSPYNVNRSYVIYELKFSGSTTRSLTFATFDFGDIIIIRRTGVTGYNVNYTGLTIYETSNAVASGIFNTSSRVRIMVFLTGGFHTLVHI
jgi:hypothetical protein